MSDSCEKSKQIRQILLLSSLENPNGAVRAQSMRTSWGPVSTRGWFAHAGLVLAVDKAECVYLPVGMTGVMWGERVGQRGGHDGRLGDARFGGGRPAVAGGRGLQKQNSKC